MKRPAILLAAILIFVSPSISAFAQPAAQPAAPAQTAEAKAKSDADQEKRAADWASLNLTDEAKAKRVTDAVATHLKAVRDWHNDHPYTLVPEGINPLSGKALNNQDRQVIADSAMPKSVHDTLMSALRADLSTEQVNAILDKYTEGKVDFTMRGYYAIVPDLTAEEAKTIRGYLEEAREQAIDFKGSKLISAIFEIYKTRSEQYLNSNGRNWKQMYKAYTDKIKAQKAAATKPA